MRLGEGGSVGGGGGMRGWKRGGNGKVFQKKMQWHGINGQNSWFSGSGLSIEKVLALTYAWGHKFTSLDDKSTSTDLETVINWSYYCREGWANGIMNHHAGQIGGSGGPSLAN